MGGWPPAGGGVGSAGGAGGVSVGCGGVWVGGAWVGFIICYLFYTSILTRNRKSNKHQVLIYYGMDSLIVFCAKYLIVAVGLIGLYVWLKQNSSAKLRLAVAVVVGGIVALIISKIFEKFYYDPRPFVSHDVKPLFPHAADNGFPSDHTLYSALVATAVYFYSRKWGWTAFALAVIIGSSRVAAHVHSPIDIIGGLLIGIVAGTAGVYTARLIVKENTKNHGAGQIKHKPSEPAE